MGPDGAEPVGPRLHRPRNVTLDAAAMVLWRQSGFLTRRGKPDRSEANDRLSGHEWLLGQSREGDPCTPLRCGWGEQNAPRTDQLGAGVDRLMVAMQAGRETRFPGLETRFQAPARRGRGAFASAAGMACRPR